MHTQELIEYDIIMIMSHQFCSWFSIEYMLTRTKSTLLRVNNHMMIIMPHWSLRMLLI